MTKKPLCAWLALMLAGWTLAGCNGGEATQTAPQTEPTAAAVDIPIPDEAEMFTQRDTQASFDGSQAVQLRFDGDTATASSDSVRISGSTVTITQEATYVLSGELTGTVVIDAGKEAKLQLVLDNASVENATGAALYVSSADKVFLTLAAGSQNRLAGGDSFADAKDDGVDGAVFCRSKLTCNGSGALEVTSPAGHGIVCKDDLTITGGSYRISAASHGLDANDSIRLRDASLDITAGKDALHAENTDDAQLGFVYVQGGALTLEAEGDGISAGSYAQLLDGSFIIQTGGGSKNGEKASSSGYGGFPGGGMGGGKPGRPGSFTAAAQTEAETDSTSMKGIKAVTLHIGGGSFLLDCADDGLHADGSATIQGGSFDIQTGDDGVHAEQTLTVSGGSFEIRKSYEGLEALHILISGGELSVTASDDGLNAAGGTDSSGYTGGRDGMFGNMGGPGGMGSTGGSITISGGRLNITASGDGIDANGSIEITGGYTVVTGPSQGDTATLDFDKSATIQGGTFIGTGAAGMAQTFSGGSQGVFAVQVGSQAAGTAFTLTDAAGNTVISHAPALNYQVVILSTPQIVSGESYTITLGDISQSFTAG